MPDSPDDVPTAGPRQHHVEMGVAAVMMILGAVTIAGSLRVGTGWGATTIAPGCVTKSCSALFGGVT